AWLLPRRNGLPCVEKPPLYFWLTALTFWAVGPSEWATRLWSALAALGTVLLTWRIGRRLYGSGVGLLAGLVIATVVGNALYIRKASTDQLFVFCLTLAMYGFIRDTERPEAGRTRFLLCYLGAALGMLAKGFLGLLFPMLIVGLGLTVVRRLSWRDLNLARGAALVLLVAGPWHALLAWRYPTLFGFYVLDNHILRFLDARRYVEDDVPSSTAAFLIGAGLTPQQALYGLGELNAYYRILRDQGLPFPFASTRPFGILLQALGVVLLVGWGLATLCWIRGWRRGAFASLVAVAGVITVLIFRLLDTVAPHHSVKEIAQAITARAGPADVIVVEGSLEYSPALPFYTGRRALLVNGAVDYFSFAATLPEARGLFIDTAELRRLWQGPRRIF